MLGMGLLEISDEAGLVMLLREHQLV